jgi:hypothetical protein
MRRAAFHISPHVPHLQYVDASVFGGALTAVD